ncbi:hypothetical protein ALC57_05765 [Trachymyrmex cornetzi]|uniref:Uncharacterized protein n=1 Tax=Trachymyrmex cornetzi TaxID=471704 RepID=A0A151JA34_9HYME|nr:hypothetical protein ALC57_05765 [Trachymyrmex cornetzi]
MENHERVERELLEQCGQVATLVERFAWLQRCDECIERLEELCRAKRPRLAVGHRQSVAARIARIADAKSQLERRFVHVGGGHASDEYASGNERSLVWREIDAAFKSRIVTGAVANFNHIEPRRFLEDAREIVLERVRDAVERHGSAKVNTAFNGEFATKDKRAIKSTNTKNIEIYRRTDIREYTSEKLELHAMDCRKINDCAIRLPSEEYKWLEFNNIELNTNFSTRAKNDFEKNLYKLMDNAVFEKTMENVRNHVDVKLLTKWDGRYGAEAMIAKPNFHSRSIFAENLIAVELRKLEVKFNKPIYVGMYILDISRECENIYETIKRDIARFDTSDYPADNAYGMSLANKKVPGLMKDENNGMIMTEFVGLRAKMYAVRVDGKKDTKKAKGVKSNVVARMITFDYTRCLNEEIETTRRQSCIRSKLHEVYTISESKITLSPYDDKRYVVPNTTETLPWGHWQIPLHIIYALTFMLLLSTTIIVL